MPQLRRAEVNKFLQKLEWLLLRKCTLSVNPPRKQRMSFRQRSITYVKSFLRAFTREKRYPTCFKFRFVSSPPSGPGAASTASGIRLSSTASSTRGQGWCRRILARRFVNCGWSGGGSLALSRNRKSTRP